jgi:hypothetical protein
MTFGGTTTRDSRDEKDSVEEFDEREIAERYSRILGFVKNAIEHVHEVVSDPGWRPKDDWEDTYSDWEIFEQAADRISCIIDDYADDNYDFDLGDFMVKVRTVIPEGRKYWHDTVDRYVDVTIGEVRVVIFVQRKCFEAIDAYLDDREVNVYSPYETRSESTSDIFQKKRKVFLEEWYELDWPSDYTEPYL